MVLVRSLFDENAGVFAGELWGVLNASRYCRCHEDVCVRQADVIIVCLWGVRGLTCRCVVRVFGRFSCILRCDLAR